MKRLLSLFLVALICLTGVPVLAQEEPVTLRVFFIALEGSDVNMVSEKLSEYTMDKLGMKVELVGIPWADYSTKMPLRIASDEEMDIGFDASWLDFVGRSRNGAYLDITQMLEKTPALVEELDDIMWEHAKVDGAIYGVPTKKEYATQYALLAETDFLKQENLDVSGVKSIYDVEFILEALQKYPERGGFMIDGLGYDDTEAVLNFVAEDKFDGTSFDPTKAAVIRVGENVFQNLYDTQEFEDLVRLMRDWYLKGYIVEDVATREDYKSYMDSFNYGLTIVGYSPLAEISNGEVYGKELTPIPVTPIIVRNNNAAASVFCIYNKSKHPEEALRFLELWNTDAYVKNLICYGIEGVHYTLDENNMLTYCENYDKLYTNGNWTSGNMFLSYLLAGESADKFEQYDAFNAAGRISVTTGFQPVVDEFNDKIIAVNGVIAEYLPLLMRGVLDPDEYLPVFRQALNDAGVEDVIAGFQTQWEAWNAGK